MSVDGEVKRDDPFARRMDAPTQCWGSLPAFGGGIMNKEASIHRDSSELSAVMRETTTCEHGCSCFGRGRE